MFITLIGKETYKMSKEKIDPVAVELLPCPFCGGPAKMFPYNGTTQATCSGSFVDCAGSDVTAPVAMWNRRASPPTLDAATVERIIEARIRRELIVYDEVAKRHRISPKATGSNTYTAAHSAEAADILLLLRALRDKPAPDGEVACPKEHIAELEGVLRAARGWVVTCSESSTAKKDLARIDAVLSYRKGNKNV